MSQTTHPYGFLYPPQPLPVSRQTKSKCPELIQVVGMTILFPVGLVCGAVGGVLAGAIIFGVIGLLFGCPVEMAIIGGAFFGLAGMVKGAGAVVGIKLK